MTHLTLSFFILSFIHIASLINKLYLFSVYYIISYMTSTSIIYY